MKCSDLLAEHGTHGDLERCRAGPAAKELRRVVVKKAAISTRGKRCENQRCRNNQHTPCIVHELLPVTPEDASAVRDPLGSEWSKNQRYSLESR